MARPHNPHCLSLTDCIISTDITAVTKMQYGASAPSSFVAGKAAMIGREHDSAVIAGQKQPQEAIIVIVNLCPGLDLRAGL